MRTLLATIVLCVPFVLSADDHTTHAHGEPDLGNIGTAHLATSCNDAAQSEIDRADALMHSFWYAEAEKGFRKAVAADPKCGMAWWGVAMANLHPLWAPPTPSELKTGIEAARRAKEIGAPTDREKAYIDAINAYFGDAESRDHRSRMLAYEKAMAKLETDNPKDREAAIFHALALIGISDPKDKSYVIQKKAAEILNRVLPEEPEHPGVAHYVIHSFDYPDLAEAALPAARVYAKLAPGSPHALHMPSHIFVRRGLWDESIASNIASAEKARAYVAVTAPGAAAFDELHAVDYLVYSYLQKGDVDAAKKLVDLTLGVTKIDNPNQFAAAYAISAVPGRWALERRKWKEAAAIAVPSTIDWTKVPYAEANIHFSRGIGAARAGDLTVARDALARLGAIRQALVEQKNAYWADQVEIQRLSVEAWIAWASDKKDEAITLQRAAADLESSTEKHPVTPGAIIPARELLAEMLLEQGKREEASKEIQQVLHDAPNRRNALAIAKKAKS